MTWGVTSLPLLAFLSGCLLPLAFAPVSFTGASLISLAVFNYCLYNSKSTKTAFVNGWLYGIGVFLVGVSWVFVSIHHYGNTNYLGAGLLTALFISALGLFYSFFAIGYYILFRQRQLPVQILGFAGLWTIIEYIRSTILTGFPWLLLGFAQVDTPLASLAPLLGVYGLSFIVAGCGSLLFWGWFKLTRRDKVGYWLIVLLIILYLSPGLLTPINWTKSSSLPLPATIVQANLSVLQKWDRDTVVQIVQQYLRMSQPLWQEGNLVIWPEGALPLVYQSARKYLQSVDDLATRHHASLLAGIFFREDGHYFNGIMTLTKVKINS